MLTLLLHYYQYVPFQLISQYALHKAVFPYNETGYPGQANQI